MAPTTALCELCPKVATNTCIACGNSRYCSKKCQKRGHKQHKLLCSTFDTFNDTNRPSELHRRAIYFPVDEAQPRFIWLPFTRKYEADYEEMYDSPVRGNLLGPNSFMQLIPIRHNAILKRDLDDTISLMIRGTGLVDGSAMNQSVNTILKGQLQEQFPWAGPMIAYGEKGTSIDPFESRDIDMADFRNLVDELNVRTYLVRHGPATQVSDEMLGSRQTHGSTPEAIDDKPASKSSTPNFNNLSNVQEQRNKFEPPTIAGVRICCEIEVAKGRPKYEAVSIPANNHIWHRKPTSEISQLIGMSIIAYSPSDSHRHEDGAANAELATLHLDRNLLLGHEFGDVKVDWNVPTDSLTYFANVPIGCAIVVRKDKQPLRPQHVEALCSWSRSKLSPLFRRIQEQNIGPLWPGKKTMFKEVTRQNFAGYYDGWLAGKGYVETAGPPNPCRVGQIADEWQFPSFPEKERKAIFEAYGLFALYGLGCVVWCLVLRFSYGTFGGIGTIIAVIAFLTAIRR
jgi:hypothetical protein